MAEMFWTEKLGSTAVLKCTASDGLASAEASVVFLNKARAGWFRS
jgi:hypothetical protein